MSRCGTSRVAAVVAVTALAGAASAVAQVELRGEPSRLSARGHGLEGGPRGTAGATRDVHGRVRGLVDEQAPDQTDEVVVHSRIRFEFGRSRVRARFRERLREIVAEIGDYTRLEITATGHTDHVGKRTDNEGLAIRRAKRACAALADVPRASCQVTPYGERRPIAPDQVGSGPATRHARLRNRRSRITITVFRDGS